MIAVELRFRGSGWGPVLDHGTSTKSTLIFLARYMRMPRAQIRQPFDTHKNYLAGKMGMAHFASVSPLILHQHRGPQSGFATSPPFCQFNWMQWRQQKSRRLTLGMLVHAFIQNMA